MSELNLTDNCSFIRLNLNTVIEGKSYFADIDIAKALEYRNSVVVLRDHCRYGTFPCRI